MKVPIILDGVVVSASAALLRSLTPGVLSGRGVFETMLAQDGKIVLLEMHLARFKKGLRYLKILSPWALSVLKENLYESLRLNRLRGARIRLMAWERKGRTHWAIVTLPYRAYTFPQYRRGFSAGISGIRRNEGSPLTRIKSLDYHSFRRALQKAQENGFDEALLLNRKGYWVEGSLSNIFFWKGRKLYTPKLSCGCLDGVTRRIVIQIAQRLNIPVKQVRAEREELFSADEAFLTNSLMGIMPLTRVQGRKIGNGRCGGTTIKLIKEYRRLIQKDVDYSPSQM